MLISVLSLNIFTLCFFTILILGIFLSFSFSLLEFLTLAFSDLPCLPPTATQQKFPDEGLANVVRNVFDFDSYNKDMREVLIEALHRHGIPIGAKPTSVKLAME